MDSGGGYALGYVAAGEWLKYSVSVAATASYTLEARVASAGQGGAFHLEVDGADVTGPMVVPSTGGWQNWITISRAGIPLTAGAHVLRVVIDTKGSTAWWGNLNYLRWIPFTASQSSVEGTSIRRDHPAPTISRRIPPYGLVEPYLDCSLQERYTALAAHQAV